MTSFIQLTYFEGWRKDFLLVNSVHDFLKIAVKCPSCSCIEVAVSINQGLSHGPALVGRPGAGPARACPSNVHLMGRGLARPSPSHFNFSRPVQARPIRFSNMSARPMTLAARPMRHGLYTDRPAISVGPPVDLTARATGRPM